MTASGRKGAALSHAPMWWMYRPVINDIRDGIQSGELQ